MTPLDHSQMLLQKAAQDEALLQAHLEDEAMSAELFGFHAQQAIEKLLKAWLAARAIHYPKTHNLQTLVELLESQVAPMPPELTDLDRLTPYATVYRYEHLPEYAALDRKGTWSVVAQVRAIVEQHVNPPAA